jgi:hypothetical protein
MTTATEVGSKLSTHEAVCAERYASINARLRRLESILLAAVGTIIVSLGAIAWQVRSGRGEGITKVSLASTT